MFKRLWNWYKSLGNKGQFRFDPQGLSQELQRQVGGLRQLGLAQLQKQMQFENQLKLFKEKARIEQQQRKSELQLFRDIVKESGDKLVPTFTAGRFGLRLEPSPERKRREVVETAVEKKAALERFRRVTPSEIATIGGLETLETPPTGVEQVLGRLQHLIPGAQPTEKKLRRFQKAQEKFGAISPLIRRRFLQQFTAPAIAPTRPVTPTGESRQKAIRWLEDNGAPVTEANIGAVIDRFEF